MLVRNDSGANLYAEASCSVPGDRAGTKFRDVNEQDRKIGLFDGALLLKKRPEVGNQRIKNHEPDGFVLAAFAQAD